MSNYRDLEIWILAREVAIKVHRMTLDDLPKFEMYEEASQIRRSAKSICHNIVEGYGRRRYKLEFVKHLVYALGSSDETHDILDILWETGSLRDEAKYKMLKALCDELGRKLNNFLQAVEQGHKSAK